VYCTHSMMCVWTKLNVCREGLYDMFCLVWVGRIFTIFHCMSIDVLFCAFTSVRSIACIVFIFNILGGSLNSPNLLSALDLNININSGFRVSSN
jgi:hypothetical protein